jgi:chloride channel protein, CIC family
VQIIIHFKAPSLQNRIPVSILLDPTLEAENIKPPISFNKQRLLIVSSLAVVIAGCISIIAKLLVYLINLITNISFHGNLSTDGVSPAHNSLGLFVIFVPALGGIVVGLMALYGSKAIRGHGIPEAMEQILTNQSKIKPAITYLKPISSAISIGTGGPFGAEGPIIATGGALGSALGQILKISHHERKVLLAAGATAGMSAIFGSPIAGIFLAIELLLFEFSPRSIIPVALACITGAAGHHLFFEMGPVFPIQQLIATPANTALGVYSVMGILIGVLSVGVTRIVYFIEDAFEKLPVHWMWWPAIGGLVVGVVGYFAPRTLGVGYDNITDILSGSLPFKVILALCFFKFISWSVALGSGTSGGTLAPLLTIGGATGALLGSVALQLFPHCGVTLPLAALVGMSAMFAGASRAFLTSIIFALETTGQSNALLPLLATCGGAYIVSFFLMENTIMTEKIARRGVSTPDSFEPDVLENINVEEVMEKNGIAISADNTIAEVSSWLTNEPEHSANYFVISTPEGEYHGILSASTIFSKHHHPDTAIGELVKRKNVFIRTGNRLKMAVQMMAKENVDVLPVLDAEENIISGIISYQHIISGYSASLDDHTKKQPHISLKRRGMKILVRGQRLISYFKESR